MFWGLGAFSSLGFHDFWVLGFRVPLGIAGFGLQLRALN